MKQRLIKYIAALLALLMCVFPMYSCSGSTAGNEDETTAASESAETTEAQTESTIYDALVPKDYGGREFRVMTAYSNYAVTNIDTAEMTAEIINDTIYERNRYVESALNIVIKETRGADGDYSAVQNELALIANAGDDVYDLMFSEAGISAASSSKGYMVNLNSIDDIDFSNPWWEQNCLTYFNILGKLYFTHTPMHLHYYESLVTVLFNKSVAEDYGIENLYQTVRDGNWTLDKMTSLALSVQADTNGDGERSLPADMYGISASTNLLPYFVLGANARFTETDSDGNVVFNGISERLISVAEKLSSVFSNSDYYIDWQTPGQSGTNGYINAFIDGSALFYIDVLGRVKEMRVMDADFGILPMPKYDESQTDYISANYVGSAIMMVPVSCVDYKDLGTILEYMSAYSYRDLIPAYYEVNINGKQVRDEDSIEMLDIMLGNITVDISLIFGWGSFVDSFVSAAMSGENIASKFAAAEKVTQKLIDKVMAEYAALE